MISIAEIAQFYENSLAGELSIARASLKHSGQKGSSLERAVQSLLKRFLPENIGVTEGIVIDSKGFVSSQLDIILYDKGRAQLFYNSESTKVVPAEFVFAVGEVKAQLNKDGYEQFFNAQLAVKGCNRYFVKSSWTYHGYGRDWSILPIASFLIAFEANETSTYEWAKQSHQDQAINSCIDAILCPQNFSIHRCTKDYGPDLMQGRMESLDCVRQHALFIFLGLLAKAAAAWKMPEDPLMANYFRTPAGFPNSLITPLINDKVQHPYCIS